MIAFVDHGCSERLLEARKADEELRAVAAGHGAVALAIGDTLRELFATERLAELHCVREKDYMREKQILPRTGRWRGLPLLAALRAADTAGTLDDSDRPMPPLRRSPARASGAVRLPRVGAAQHQSATTGESRERGFLVDGSPRALGESVRDGGAKPLGAPAEGEGWPRAAPVGGASPPHNDGPRGVPRLGGLRARSDAQRRGGEGAQRPKDPRQDRALGFLRLWGPAQAMESVRESIEAARAALAGLLGPTEP
ncbi:MAG: hypothetical protein MUE73_12190, partial [Planctomycetes bacterium]|nr:hypothetical protein [Planctomycetota bacterium]